MRNDRLVATLLGFCLAVGAVFIAQAQDRAPAEIQREYDQFIGSFRAAVQGNDVEAVAALTRFPFFWQDQRSAAEFRRTVYRRVFTPRIRSCIARQRSVYERDGEGNHNLLIFCGDQIFRFTRTPAGFRFTEIGVND